MVRATTAFVILGLNAVATTRLDSVQAFGFFQAPNLVKISGLSSRSSSCRHSPEWTLSMKTSGQEAQGDDDGRRSRRSLLAAGVKQASLLSLSMAWLRNPSSASAKKIINLEEARELGEKKMEEIEKAKGPLIKLTDGVRYREEFTGKGDTFQRGDLVKIRYQVYKGNGDYMFSTGYGREFQNDVGDTYDFTFGRPDSIPKGAEIGMEGMRVGGKRKISIPPALGWTTSGGMPEPQTFSGKRKFLNHVNENLQFEVELIRVKKKTGSSSPAAAAPAPAASSAT